MAREVDKVAIELAKGLKPQQRLFAYEYAIDGNGGRAAISAGYAEKGASVTSNRLLKNTKIRALIDHLIGKQTQKLEITAEWLLAQLVLQYQGDMRKLYGPNGELLPPDQWPDEVAMTIEGVDTKELIEEGKTIGYTRKVKQSSKLKALELIGRHKGVQAFQENVEINAGADLIAAIKAGRKRIGRDDE